MGNGKRKRKSLSSPNYLCHGHKYDTRSKRLCSFCSSHQESTAAVEHDIQTKVPRILLQRNARSQGLVACKGTRFPTKPKNIAFPDDLIFTILLFMPAKVLYEIMRLVCRGWRHTITTPSFINNHLQISSNTCTNGILIDHPDKEHLALYIEPQTDNVDNDFHVTELAKPPFRSEIMGSYHGLALLLDLTNQKLFHVVNLVTNAVVSLPPFPERTRDLPGTGMALSYASSIARYKVVHLDYEEHYKRGDSPHVLVCTIGVDQFWRKIDVQGMDTSTIGTYEYISLTRPFVIRGNIYWINTLYAFGFAMDVDTERVYKFPLFTGPYTALLENSLGRCIHLHTGLGFVRHNWDKSFGINIWELYECTDMKSREWTKKRDIDVRVLRSKFEKYFYPGAKPLMKPLLYTGNEDLWFRTALDSWITLFCYNMRTGKVVPFPVKKKNSLITAFQHLNTLLTLRDC